VRGDKVCNAGELELALREVMNRITVMLDSDKIELYTCSFQIKIKQRPRDLTVLHNLHYPKR
jgi:hypothetical protein